jgi:hypothetical protein
VRFTLKMVNRQLVLGGVLDSVQLIGVHLDSKSLPTDRPSRLVTRSAGLMRSFGVSSFQFLSRSSTSISPSGLLLKGTKTGHLQIE